MTTPKEPASPKATSKENLVRVITFIQPETMEALKQISSKNFYAPISGLVRAAVEEFVKRHLQTPKTQ
jgi:hypothetical protein